MSQALTSYDAARTFGDGVQPWSAGPLYPWSIVVVDNATTGCGRVWAMHPDGRTTTPFAYDGVTCTLADAIYGAEDDARDVEARSQALSEAKAAIREASNVYDLFAAIIHHDEVQACS